MEEKLREVWSSVLGVSDVPVDAEFVQLGGNSLSMIIMLDRAKRAGVPLTFEHVQRCKTIRELVTALGKSSSSSGVKQEEEGGPFPLLPGQHFWLGTERDNMPTMIVEGKPSLDADRAEAAFRAAVQHHQAFRIRFQQDGSGWRQSFAADANAAFDRHDVSGSGAEWERAMEEILDHAHGELDVSNGPLVRGVFFRTPEHQPDRLALIAHHVIMDRWSEVIFENDIAEAYQQLKNGQEVVLPQVTTSLPQAGNQIQKAVNETDITQFLDYWLKQAPSNPTPPAGKQPHSAGCECLGAALPLSDETARQGDLEAAIVSGIVKAVWERDGHRPVTIHFTGHGRTHELLGKLDLSRTLGCFWVMYPVCFDIPESATPKDFLSGVRAALNAVPHGGVSYLLLRDACPDETVRQRLQQHAEPQIVHNFYGDDRAFGNTEYPDVRIGVRLEPSRDFRRRRIGSVGSLFVSKASVTSEGLKMGALYDGQLHSSNDIQPMIDRGLQFTRQLLLE